MLALLAVTGAACSSGDEPAADADGSPATTAENSDTGPPPTRTTPATLDLGDASVLRVAVGANTAATTAFDAASDVVLLVADDTWAATAALPLAAREQAPAVVTADDALATFDTLGVQTVWGVGSATSAVAVEWDGDEPAYTDLRADDPTVAALAVADEVEADAIVCVPADDWQTAIEVAAHTGPRAVVVPDGPALAGWLEDNGAVLVTTADDVLRTAGAVPGRPTTVGGPIAATAPADGTCAAVGRRGLDDAELQDAVATAVEPDDRGTDDQDSAGDGSTVFDDTDADDTDADDTDADDTEVDAGGDEAGRDEGVGAADLPTLEDLLDPGEPADTAWLLEATSAETLPALVTAAARGARPVVRDPADLRLGPVPPAGSLVDDVTTLASFDVAEADAWQWQTAATGVALPGGGQLLFPGRRMVALYGNHETPVLGVLGEQGPEASVERVRGLAAEYDVDDAVVVPAWEMIATIAAAEATDDGDYSRESEVDDLREWIDVASENDVYVVLDLQPGRTRFVEQAERYRELLELPNVGLALDPEWRLLPNQVHLRQIGSVQVDEVNEVVDWLAELTREQRLPQKLLIIHQFNVDMVRGDRSAIEQPPELAVMVHVDGQGAQNAKDGTYARMTTAGGEFWWGWKNFYDEDLPGIRSPADTLAVTPQPVFISYQ